MHPLQMTPMKYADSCQHSVIFRLFHIRLRLHGCYTNGALVLVY